MIERKKQLLKGAARLLDIGSTINRSKHRKSIQEDAREIIARANQSVTSILYSNIGKHLNKQTAPLTSQRPVKVKMQEIENKLNEIRRELERVKSGL